MPATPWTPKIVGGTHFPLATLERPRVRIKDLERTDASTRRRELKDKLTALQNRTSPVDEHGPLDFVFNPSEELVETTHEKLSAHASTISPDLNPTWDYGPTVRIRDGITMVRGQYVVESHNGVKIRTYWVPS